MHERSAMPTEAKWWDNHHHGRVLACRHQSVTIFVPVVHAYCSECRTPLELVADTAVSAA
jgi:hypothetical protein